jgi:hypothetical protein
MVVSPDIDDDEGTREVYGPENNVWIGTCGDASKDRQEIKARRRIDRQAAWRGGGEEVRLLLLIRRVLLDKKGRRIGKDTRGRKKSG